MQSWQKYESNFSYRLFNDASAKSYISDRYAPECIEAYEYCHHPAMRSDYFRLAYLLYEGGIYIDADDECQRAGLTELIRPSDVLSVLPMVWQLIPSQRTVPAAEVTTTAAYIHEWKYYFNNAPLACHANNPVIEIAFKRATQCIIDSKRVNRLGNIHYHTGPDNLTFALMYHAIFSLNRHDDAPSINVLHHWDKVATTKHLSYKSDERNWRSNAAIYRS
jgi:hypothetical protein